MDLQHNPENALWAGAPLEQAKKVLFLLHGRGATASSMLPLAGELGLTDTAFIAPQASRNTWYPFPFLAPPAQNEPGLSSALRLLKTLTAQLQESGFSTRQLYFLGFSQGACLTAEFCARYAAPYGGVFILTGGLIGDVVEPGRYQGDFQQTPVFFGSSDVDPHVPESRVLESAEIYRQLGASVTLKIYPNMPHTVIQDEVEWVRNEVRSTI